MVLEPVGLLIMSRLRWFGPVEPKVEADWVEHYTAMRVETVRQMRRFRMVLIRM